MATITRRKAAKPATKSATRTYLDPHTLEWATLQYQVTPAGFHAISLMTTGEGNATTVFRTVQEARKAWANVDQWYMCDDNCIVWGD